VSHLWVRRSRTSGRLSGRLIHGDLARAENVENRLDAIEASLRELTIAINELAGQLP
jgi:hypothetical protein